MFHVLSQVVPCILPAVCVSVLAFLDQGSGQLIQLLWSRKPAVLPFPEGPEMEQATDGPAGLMRATIESVLVAGCTVAEGDYRGSLELQRK